MEMGNERPVNEMGAADAKLLKGATYASNSLIGLAVLTFLAALIPLALTPAIGTTLGVLGVVGGLLAVLAYSILAA